MVRLRRDDKQYQRKIARERISILLSLARKVVKTHPDRSRKYVKLAWEIAKKFRVRLGKKKYTFCRVCYTPWTSDTLRVRLVRKPYPTVVYKCLHCGAEFRLPYIKEKKSKQKSSFR